MSALIMSPTIETYLSALLVVSLKAVVLAIVAGIFLHGLRIRDSNLRHRVWTAVLLAMLLLPALAWVTPSVPFPEIVATPQSLFSGSAANAGFLTERNGKPIALRPSTVSKASMAQEDIATEKAASPTPKQAVPTGNQTLATTSDQLSAIAQTEWIGAPWIFAAYAVGLVTLLGRLFLGIWSARRLAKQAELIPSLGLGQLGCGRYDIAASKFVRVPLTVGIVRPRVLLPADWPSWSAEMLASVLRHEQAHIDRRDLWVALLAEINRCVYWFHPLAWFLRKRVAALAEQSCDDSVISATGDRSEYAGHLLNIASRMRGATQRAVPLGVSMARTSQVESRIDAILDAKRPLARRLGWRRAVTLTAVILPLVLFAASVRAVDKEENASGEQTVAEKSETVADAKGDDNSTPLNIPVGFWAKYRVEAKFSGLTEQSKLTIAFLNKATRQEQACRWIEVINEYEGDREAVITRLLIPEEHLRLGTATVEKALVVLQRVGKQSPTDFTKYRCFFDLLMPVRYDDSQPHGPEPVEFNIGGRKMERPIPGWTNRRLESEENPDELPREIVTRRWVMESEFLASSKAQETIRQLNAEKTILRTTTVMMTDGGRGAKSQFTDGPLPPFALTPGWEWALSPRSCNYSSSATLGMVIMIDKEDESFTLRIAYSSSEQTIRLRPVAFDAARKRYDFGPRIGGMSDGVGMYVFKLSKDVPINSITDIGIERLTKQGLKVVAESAAKPAREVGLEPLPFPIVGQPYTFRLTSTENKALRSEDFRGKVVLIDCWATTCGPCMVKMPKLKSLYEKWHQDGLEVIGVNFDHASETMQKTVDAKELPWPQVLVPTDSKKRELWEQASGITNIPRLLLLDRQGNLHSDRALGDLENLVEQLMKEK